MTINNTIISELEHTYRKSFPDDLKRYLLVEYGAEPFPYEFSEQDLYTNIQRDICDYEAGKLDISVKSASERWQEEREYLQTSGFFIFQRRLKFITGMLLEIAIMLLLVL